MPNTSSNIAFIGFGEAGQAFARGMKDDNDAVQICAFDIKRAGPEGSAVDHACKSLDVRNVEGYEAACEDAHLIFCLVTADAAEEAARSTSGNPLNGQLFLDCNSCEPSAKRRSADVIEAAGGKYVDVAVMTPVHPKLHRATCLVSGPHAEAAIAEMNALGMDVSVAGPEIGEASTRKMVRSVMIKGLEALTLECFLAARKAGIEDEIITTLDSMYPGFDWATRAPYMMERAITHGTRRAAEMRAAAKTLEDLGIDPCLTQGTVQRQNDVGALKLNANNIGADNIGALTDAILDGLKARD